MSVGCNSRLREGRFHQPDLPLPIKLFAKRLSDEFTATPRSHPLIDARDQISREKNVDAYHVSH